MSNSEKISKRDLSKFLAQYYINTTQKLRKDAPQENDCSDWEKQKKRCITKQLMKTIPRGETHKRPNLRIGDTLFWTQSTNSSRTHHTQQTIYNMQHITHNTENTQYSQKSQYPIRNQQLLIQYSNPTRIAYLGNTIKRAFYASMNFQGNIFP